MKSSDFTKIAVAIIIISSLAVITILAPKKIKEYRHSERKAEIRKSTEALLGNCALDSFQERRDCFQAKLAELRNSNSQVKTKYNLIYNEKTIPLLSEDEGDLVKIKKESSLSFFSCLSNTFFVHWDLEYIFLSLENPFGVLICKDREAKDIIIAPADLTADQLTQTIKGLKQTQIK